MLDRKSKCLKALGIILFCAGSIVAISFAAKMPEAGSDFPSTVVFFPFALGLGIIGNILWHMMEKKTVLVELKLHKDDEEHNPILILERTVPHIEKLKEEFDTLERMELCERIDDIMDYHIHPFTDKRRTFIDILGQANGSEVLLMIAYAERMLNRVWSASSDGHPGEAKSSLDDSIETYRRALAKALEYNKQVS